MTEKVVWVVSGDTMSTHPLPFGVYNTPEEALKSVKEWSEYRQNLRGLPHYVITMERFVFSEDIIENVYHISFNGKLRHTVSRSTYYTE